MWILRYCGKRLNVLYEVLYIFLFYSRQSENSPVYTIRNKIQSLQNLQKQHFTEQQATQLSSLKEEYDLLSPLKGRIYFT